VNKPLTPLVATALFSFSLVGAAQAAPSEWYDYRHDEQRSGDQRHASALSNPTKVQSLAVKWWFPAQGNPAVGSFKASPVVVDDTVYVGSQDGRFYALDAKTGTLKWEYPKPPAPALLAGDPAMRYGIQSSAAYWERGGGKHDVVIFGAQDPALGPFDASHQSFGSARLFALDARTGAVVWKSQPVATITGTTYASTSELHQRIGYSAPLIFDKKVYVGVHDFGDDPIQVGRVVAVHLANGHVDPAFQFRAVGTAASPPGTRGGGVWNAPATDGKGVYFTTGNTRCDAAGCQSPEPSPNHGLSMIRVDRNSGKIVWAWQPVPYAQDADPDWSAGAAVMSTTCGRLVASVQKDGWTYAVETRPGTAGSPKVRWQFPPTGYGAQFLGAAHGDDHYKRPGAAWGDVLFITTGGESLVADGVTAGYGKLHALNACARSHKDRVRWILDVPHNSVSGYSLGAPTVTGGIVFIGTDQGHLIVIADPSVHPGTGWRCSNIDYTTVSSCHLAGYRMVPIPKVLADVTMPDGGDIAGLRDEPSLAKGRVFVATGAGHVFMLVP